MALKSTWQKVDELEAGKQDLLVSGTNIKTINGSSILGSGNLVVSGGGGVPDGDKGDITVSGSGSVWTIDNGAVTNAKINDVDATKVTEDGTHRFVTDTEKTTWNGKQDSLVSGTNIKSIEGQSLLGSGNIDLSKSDVGLSNVDNTSDLNKPISTATQTALNGKQDTLGFTPVPNTRTINGFDLTTNRTLTAADVSAVPTTRTLTINGSTQDLSADRTFTISSPDGYTTIVKPSSQDVTNAGLTIDNDLQFSVTAGGHYLVDMDIALSANNTTGDYIFDFEVSAGTMTGKGTCQTLTTVGGIANIVVISNAVTSTTDISTGSSNASLDDVYTARILFAFTATANGIFRYRFGNVAPASGRISRTWKGSIMRYKNLD